MKKHKKKLMKLFFLTLLLIFSMPIFAFAATSSDVTYDTKGATGTVPPQEAFEQFVSTHKDIVYAIHPSNNSLRFYGISKSVDDTLTVNADGTLISTTKPGTEIVALYDNLYPESFWGSYSTTVFTLASYDVVVPVDPVDPDIPPIQGGENKNMLESLTATTILAESTKWANNFDGLLLVVVGVGIGFACVRFVKSLFF